MVVLVSVSTVTQNQNIWRQLTHFGQPQSFHALFCPYSPFARGHQSCLCVDEGGIQIKWEWVCVHVRLSAMLPSGRSNTSMLLLQHWRFCGHRCCLQKSAGSALFVITITILEAIISKLEQKLTIKASKAFEYDYELTSVCLSVFFLASAPCFVNFVKRNNSMGTWTSPLFEKCLSTHRCPHWRHTV